MGGSGELGAPAARVGIKLTAGRSGGPGPAPALARFTASSARKNVDPPTDILI